MGTTNIATDLYDLEISHPLHFCYIQLVTALPVYNSLLSLYTYSGISAITRSMEVYTQGGEVQ